MFEIEQGSMSGLISLIQNIGDAFVVAGGAVNAFFGGMEMIIVDIVIAIQNVKNLLADMQMGIGLALIGMGNLGGATGAVSRALGTAMVAEASIYKRDNLDNAGLEEFRQEEYTRITGTGPTRAPRGRPREPTPPDPNIAKEQLALEIRLRTQNQLNDAFGQTEHQLNLVKIAQERQNALDQNAITTSTLSLDTRTAYAEAQANAATLAENNRYKQELLQQVFLMIRK